MSQAYDFQSIILKLQQFWHEQGCLIWQPYYTQVGAGTNNPATVLRVLGPEPWNVAYVEPSVRPDDARYGENPNRLQQHYQFQVILKPDPGNPQELYIRSLQALGIDPRQHDIRFVEDNWETPALGAWGLGWEVWLDGQEITQFTYFQQAGGTALYPISVELTYGLERIAMPLQRVRHFTKIQWSPERTYGDVNLKAEQEHSTYYFEVADVDRLRSMFDLFEKEAWLSLDHGLVLPAHDYVLKCSHTFNVLDTRGAVGVTERQDLFRRMRDISRKVAESYLQQRQEMEFPWLVEGEDAPSKLKDAVQVESVSSMAGIPKELPPAADLLFEIGTEELPADDQDTALAQLKELASKMLEDLRLSHGEIKILGTPRRLVVLVEQVASRQEAVTLIHKGPPANRAFDADGNPTRAAEGFARSKGVTVADLEIREMDGGQYVVAEVHEDGKNAVEVLAEALPELISKIRFEKSMRWNSKGLSFSRPIRWLLAVFGEYVIPFHYAGLNSGNTTRGLRFYDPDHFTVQNAEWYLQDLRSQGIVLNPDERREKIREQVLALTAEVNGVPKIDERLLEEVNYLVEAPTVLRGTFEEEHLNLPEPVLISVMKKYQRYFPVRSTETGRLLPYFLVTRNGDEQYSDIVIDGNELVIKARFADAAFFISEDLKQEFESYLPKLDTLIFQFKLGSMLDKTNRLVSLVDELAPLLAVPADQIPLAKRAARLCKADLVTHMVVEMTALQGLMGRYYALKAGEKQEVADAIYEHYLPSYAGDELPRTRLGFLLGLADRLDSLSGLFAAGLAPTGTRDPFAQRRMALGLVLNLIHWDQDFDLKQALQLASAHLPVEASKESLQECLAFIIGRMRVDFLDRGIPYDVVEAVLAAQGHNPNAALKAARSLTAWTKREYWREILPAYSRCVRITRDMKESYQVTADKLVEPAELALYKALEKAEAVNRESNSVEQFFEVFLPLIPLINRFFDEVLVMSEDPAERQNRLGLLQHIVALAANVADFSHLEGF
jgi:glycyl-tRNA synthetase